MTNPTPARSPRNTLRIAALCGLAAWAVAQEPATHEVPAPVVPSTPGEAELQAADRQLALPAETLDPSAIGPAVIEDMAAVLRR